MNCSFRNGPPFLGIEPHTAERICYHVTVDRLRRMTCPPANDVTAQPALSEYVPERFAFARRARVRTRSAVHWVRLYKPMDAMFIGKLTGGHRIPKHGRKNRLKRSEIAHHPAVDESV